MTPTKEPSSPTASVSDETGNREISEAELPHASLESALQIVHALLDIHAGQPTSPSEIANTLAMQETLPRFRELLSASRAYGLTKGGYRATKIALEPLALQIMRPRDPAEGRRAKRKALLNPRIVGEFLRKLDENILPADHISRQILNELGVPSKKTAEALIVILEGATALDLVKEEQGQQRVRLGDNGTAPDEENDAKASDTELVTIGYGPLKVSVPYRIFSTAGLALRKHLLLSLVLLLSLINLGLFLDNRLGVGVLDSLGSGSTRVSFEKTYIFWVPPFSHESRKIASEKVAEEEFHQWLVSSFGGWSRWKVQGASEGEMETGYFYQASLPRNKEDIGVMQIRETIQRYFEQTDFYVIEITHR